ncbi:HD domain-containing phosphohydrolase [Atrimonas thermophila]|uniref:HD domain-containing phosphohydrolase n=1 Tax=Atrimonas thermophila TaxID=3064161 RepID=UPI00399C8EDB
MEKTIFENYRLLIQNLPDGFAYHQIVLDEQGQPIDYLFLEVNPAFEELTGLKREKILGRRVTEVLPGIERSSFDWIGTYGQVALTGETMRFESFSEPLSRWFEVTAYSDRRGFFATIFRDITELKKTQERQQKLLDAIPYSVLLLNRERRILAQNKVTRDVAGSKVGDLCWFSFHGTETLSEEEREEFERTGVLPASARCIFCRADEALEKQQTIVEEVEIRGRVYETGWVPVDGETYLHYSIDITKYREMERTLRRERDRLREYLRIADIIFVVLNLQGEVVLINQKGAEILGYPQEEILGKNWFDFFIPERLRDKIRNVFQGVVAGEIEQFGYYENPILDRYGRERLIAWRNTLLKNEQGQIEEVIAAGLDITEARKMEEKLRYLSFHDSLTGLYNRAFLEEEFRRLDVARQLPLSVIMVDVNGLKLVNDTYGHQVGDLLLRSAARVLQIAVRKEDIIARYGGDEFVVLLPQTSYEMAQEVCQRIRDHAETVKVHDVPLSLALGVATKTRKSESVAEILRRAEDEMYRQKLAEAKSTRSAIINALLRALEAKSYETEQHVLRMQEVGVALARALGLPQSELSRLQLAILLHDIGKIAIPEEILKKPGPLTPSEWEMVKKHPEVGYRIVRAMQEFAQVAEEVYSHHERFDGTGYPRGLQGEAIPILARIIAVVDAYDAMRYGRSYKNPLEREEIIAEFRRNAGKQFDPKLVEIFLTLFEQGVFD